MPGRKLRIIGGNLRSRRVEFPDIEGLRPTPDRVRETLFNWLHGQIHDARCLEPFAGSGILSLEAYSRGAGYCCALDRSPAIIAQLKQSAAQLDIDPAHFHAEVAEARQWLGRYNSEPFDLVFLDPPFADKDLAEVIRQVAAPEILTPNGYVYVESPSAITADELPPEFGLHRQKRAGAVHYGLITRQAS